MAELITKDYESFAKETSLFQFEDKPVIQGMLKSWAEVFQDLEDVTHSFYGVNIYTAVGVQLDELYGELFNVPRLLRDDETYRGAILARIATLGADGTIENLHQNIVTITQSEFVHVYEHFPADVHIHVGGTYSGYTYNEAKNLTLAGVSTRLIIDNQFQSFTPTLILSAGVDLQIYVDGVPHDLQITVDSVDNDLQISAESIDLSFSDLAILPELDDEVDGIPYIKPAMLLYSDTQIVSPASLIVGVMSEVEDDDVCVATGTVTVLGSASITEDDDTAYILAFTDPPTFGDGGTMGRGATFSDFT